MSEDTAVGDGTAIAKTVSHEDGVIDLQQVHGLGFRTSIDAKKLIFTGEDNAWHESVSSK